MEERRTLRPHEFTGHELTPDKFSAGAEHTLENFYAWQDENPNLIASHVNNYTEYLQRAIIDYSVSAKVKRRLTPGAREAFKDEKRKRDISFFAVYNLGEMPDTATLETFGDCFSEHDFNIQKFLKEADKKGDAVTITEIITKYLPALRDQPELPWLDAQMRRLYEILPENIIQAGGMGKAARTTAGVLAIGLYDTLEEPFEVQKAHLTRILPSAYAYGAMYAIIDDILQDSSYVSDEDKARYHEKISHGLRTGEHVGPMDFPDHPLSEELLRLQDYMLDAFPFAEYRNLYYAGETMYWAQHRDAHLTAEDIALGGLRSIYPDLFVKSSMSRVVANILGRRTVPDEYYKRAVNINLLNQFRDDLQDYRSDRQAGRMTPFSYEGPLDRAPLNDLFGYSAYISHYLFGDTAEATRMLTSFSAYRLAVHFLNDKQHAQEMLELPQTTDEMVRFIDQVNRLPPRISDELKRPDIELQDIVARISRRRPQTAIDPRTFVSDRKEYINNLILEKNGIVEGELGEVMKYALSAGGKRLRPALTLMLAEGIGVAYESVEPLIKTVELFHTSSLIFDDLPAQDNAALRRGKPTSHLAFGEGRAQLAGIAMMSSGFGGLSELQKVYPADKILDVLEYCGSVLGPQRLCRGQAMDLEMSSDATVKDIIEMYNLKTSTLIEASLVPVMMLEGRPVEEIELISQFSYHAGIVFQLRDDILDMTSESEQIGKDANGDGTKANVARLKGVEAAEELMEQHLKSALAACSHLPFNTKLLERTALYFARRNK